MRKKERGKKEKKRKERKREKKRKKRQGKEKLDRLERQKGRIIYIVEPLLLGAYMRENKLKLIKSSWVRPHNRQTIIIDMKPK